MGVIIWTISGTAVAWLYWRAFGGKYWHVIFIGVVGALAAGWIITMISYWPTLIGLNFASIIPPVMGSILANWLVSDLQVEEELFQVPFRVPQMLVKRKLRHQ